MRTLHGFSTKDSLTIKRSERGSANADTLSLPAMNDGVSRARWMMDEKFEPLFDSFSFPCGITLKNRLLMAPMTTWSSNEDSTISTAELDYYRERAQGIGAVITAAAYVSAEGQGFHHQIGAHHDDMLPSLQQLAKTIQSQGTKAILQIFHGGRMCPPELIGGQQPVSASAIAATRKGAATPREMSESEIDHLIIAFGEATRRAIAAGFDGVEIHGANTYLIQQFFSPHSNRRHDQWGGSVEQRMNFPLAIIDKVLETVSRYAKTPFIVGYRLSPEEVEEPGIKMSDTLQFVTALIQKPMDYLHVSVMNFWGGSMRDESDKISRTLLIQKQMAEKMPLIGVGSLRTADEALQALNTGVPLIALGRELITEPYWIQKVKDGEVQKIRTTISANTQKELIIPDGLWQMIINSPGWFPLA